MKVIFAAALLVVVAVSTNPRSKRQAYQLPDGVDFIVGPVRTTFQCQQDGYYADIDNNCQIFHVCHTANHPDGRSEIQHYSFFCGNQTIFNQLSLTCSYPEESIPCQNAADFFYLNQRIGQEKEFFHQDQDIERAAPLLGRGAPLGARPGPAAAPRPFPGRG